MPSPSNFLNAWKRRIQPFVWITIATLIICLVLPYPAVEATVTPKHYTDLTLPPLPPVKIPKYSHFQMQNGINVFLIEDHELPLINGMAVFPSGSRQEPSSQTGLAALTGHVMRSGGTQAQSPDELNQFLENRAASVESFMGKTASGASFSSLKADFEDVLTAFTDVLRRPAFAPQQFDLAKAQTAGGIARRNDDPQGIVGREFQKLIYGAESPYARTVEYKTLDNVHREDAIAFYQHAFQPQQMILGVIGDFNSREVRSQLQSRLEDWKAAQPALEASPTRIEPQQKGVYFVDQPQLSQSYVQIGHLGGQLNSPDYPPLSVMNQVLNGFGGRLFNEVRSRQGLAYTVYAEWSPQYDYPGLFVAGGETRSESTVKFIQALRQELQKIQSAPISQPELQLAKDKVLNSFVFNFQDPSQTLSRLLWYKLFGYPQDFVFQYQKAVQQTTTADVLRVAKTYLKPENSVTFVVGSQQKIQPPLQEVVVAGEPIQTVDVTIAPPTEVQNPQKLR